MFANLVNDLVQGTCSPQNFHQTYDIDSVDGSMGRLSWEHTLCRQRAEFVVRGRTWTGWVITKLITELVANLIIEADLVGLIHDGSQYRTWCAHLGETKHRVR
jgi:hypothetical protein